MSAAAYVAEEMKKEGEPRLLALGDLLAEFEEHATALHEAKQTGKPIGPVTAFENVNLELGGAFAPGLHIIHGEAGAGKTAFALQTACQCQCPALFLSCEMGPIELLRRIASRVTGEFLGRFKTGEYPPAKAVGFIKQGIASAPLLRIADATDNPASHGWIETTARFLQRSSESGHILIVVDSVHSWAEAVYENLTEYDALSLGLADLKKIASRLNCPVLGIAERNRASMTKGGLSASAGNRKFEFKSETVLDLSHEKEGQGAEDAEGWADIKLTFAKNRNGAKGKPVKLRFNGQMQKFDQRLRGW